MAPLLLTVVLSLLVPAVPGQGEGLNNCTPSDYPEFTDPSDTSAFAPTSQFLVNQHPFGCNGRVSRWEVYTVGSDTHPIEFTVWRFNSFISVSVFGILVNGSIYDLVGSNYFANAAPGEDNLLSLEVPPEEQIEIQEGDIPGIRSILFTNSTAVSPFQVQLSLPGGVLFYTLDRTEVTPQSMEVVTVQPRLGTPVLRVIVNTTDDVFESTTSTVTTPTVTTPTVTTPTVTTPTVTTPTVTTPTVTTPTVTTPTQSLNLIVITVPVLVVGVTLLVTVAVAVVLCGCVIRKQLAKKRVELSNNIAYDHSNPVQLPTSGQGDMQLSTNIAYNHRGSAGDADIYYSRIEDI